MIKVKITPPLTFRDQEDDLRPETVWLEWSLVLSLVPWVVANTYGPSLREVGTEDASLPEDAIYFLTLQMKILRSGTLGHKKMVVPRGLFQKPSMFHQTYNSENKRFMLDLSFSRGRKRKSRY